MVALRTSSYQAWRPEYGQPVRITLGPPRQPEPTGRKHWLYVAELAPRGWYFRSPHEVFARAYRDQLNRYAAAIDDKLAWLAEAAGAPLVLCCFERRVTGPEQCHRLQFSQWWTERTGHAVPELDGAHT